MQYGSLFAFNFMYYVMIGISMFVPKYYGEIGLSDGWIGVMTSIPTIIAMVAAPLIAMLTDRVAKKKTLLLIMLALMTGMCLVIARMSSVLGLLLSVSIYTIFSTSAQPLGATIALEYTQEQNKDYGKVRLFGTVGYQVGALLVGYLLSERLDSLYPLMGAALLLACLTTLAMPDIRGHQHKSEKVPLTKLFADKHIRWLYILLMFSTITSQFYYSFFSKYLGDLGMSNEAVSWITLLAVILEIPFLYYADKIGKRINIWNCLMLAMAINGVRWIMFAYCRNFWPILLCQIPGVTLMACFEFYPAVYLSRKVAPELSGASQNILSLASFGTGKIFGSLIGGQICNVIGIPAMFTVYGVMLLAGLVVFWPKTRELIREDSVRTLNE